MKRKGTYWCTGVSLVILALALGGLYQGPGIGNVESRSTRPCPSYVEVGPQYQVEIVRMHFTDHVEHLLGTSTIHRDARGMYRFVVVTLKVTKPAGASLTLAAADLTLHYYHGSETEVTCCMGLSRFKNDSNADVPVLLNPYEGPGFIKQTTGPGSVGSAVVYIDAVFVGMEPDTAECWICLGHPTTTEPFVCPSPAWTSESDAPETVAPSIRTT